MDRARYWARSMSRRLQGRWRMRSERCARAACACALLAALCAFALWLALPAGPPRTATYGPVLRRLPVAYWIYRRDHPDIFKSSSCMTAPGPLQIHYAAAYWQRVATDPAHSEMPEYSGEDGAVTQVFVFGAYWDARVSPTQVRLIVHCDKELPLLYCHFWYYHTGVSQRSFAEEVGWTATGGHSAGTRLVSCPLPPPPAGSPRDPRRAAPVAVSLERDVPCRRATTMLLIQNSPTASHEGMFQWAGAGAPPPAAVSGRESVVVCVVWQRSGDAASALTEWLLMLHDMLVDRVYVYLPNAHENVLRVLEYFTWMHGPLVELTPWRRAPGAGDDRAAQLDCLYRARGRHSWLAMLDLDTMLLPLRDKTLPNFVAVSTNEFQGGNGAVGDMATRGVRGIEASWAGRGAAGAAGGGSGGASGGGSGGGSQRRPAPDVLQLRRFLFPGALQDDHTRGPPGRILAHDWREPQPLEADYEHMTATLLNTATVVTIGRNMSCVTSCRVLPAAGGVARAHVYHARCRGRRASCRALRMRAVRDRAARHWDVAARADLTLRRLRLHPRRHTELDDQ